MFNRHTCMTQWLIGIFVRLLSSKDDLINCAGVGKRTLFIQSEFFPTPFLQFLFQFGDCHHDFHWSHIVEIQILQFRDHCIFCLLLKEGHLFSNL